MAIRKRLITVLGGIVLAGFLAGCQTTGSGGDELVEKPVDELYNKALASLEENRYKKAAKQFEEVERQHPYSQWARRAILMSAFAYYEASRYDSAIEAGKRFLTLHPGSEDAPYAQYIVANSYYEQIANINRDQELTRLALHELNEVVQKYPNTDYARDSRLKMDLAKDHLAGKEMQVGRYYLERHSYVAAINRFKKVVTDYQTTTHVEEALMRLAEAYMALGVKNEAQTAAAVLGHNYPGSRWYHDAYVLLKSDGLVPREDQSSWISRALRRVSPI